MNQIYSEKRRETLRKVTKKSWRKGRKMKSQGNEQSKEKESVLKRGIFLENSVCNERKTKNVDANEIKCQVVFAFLPFGAINDWKVCERSLGNVESTAN